MSVLSLCSCRGFLGLSLVTLKLWVGGSKQAPPTPPPPFPTLTVDTLITWFSSLAFEGLWLETQQLWTMILHSCAPEPAFFLAPP